MSSLIYDVPSLLSTSAADITMSGTNSSLPSISPTSPVSQPHPSSPRMPPSPLSLVSPPVAFSYAFVSILKAAIRIADIIFSCLTFFVVNLLFSWGKNVERFSLWTTRKPQVWHILDLKRERDSFEINSALLALPSFLSHACWRLQAWVAWSTQKVCFSLAGLQHAS